MGPTGPSTWPNRGRAREQGSIRYFVRGIGAVLIAVTVGAFALGALSTVDLIVPAGWWQPTIALGATASAAMLVLFFEPELVLGLGIDAVLVWVVVTRAWVP